MWLVKLQVYWKSKKMTCTRTRPIPLIAEGIEPSVSPEGLTQYQQYDPIVYSGGVSKMLKTKWMFCFQYPLFTIRNLNCNHSRVVTLSRDHICSGVIEVNKRPLHHYIIVRNTRVQSVTQPKLRPLSQL